MNTFDYLLPTDWIAIGVLLSMTTIACLATCWDIFASKIADRRSALLEEHWATTIREEK